MKKRTEQDHTKLADAAFRQVARTVIAEAVQTGTPVILWVNGEVKAVDPRTLLKKRKRPRRG